MKTKYSTLIGIGVLGLASVGYLGYYSYQALTFGSEELNWMWVESPLLRYDTTATQSTRTSDTKQLIYRKVDLKQQLAVSLNTTNNRYFMFTFIKSMHCDEQTKYSVSLYVNNQTPDKAQFTCLTPDTAIFRIARPYFEQLILRGNDLKFELDINQWDFNSLKKDDYMQHNYKFFRQHSSEPIEQWSRD
ncbi:hypothetical protein [Vibrio sp. Y2-5]|uniref:hypothetical protein n=1 Tax=Vibrio sp. Y2-5 TaxID=2743977 RepID=UPI001CB743BD|nr:hypothetical protein [Vibrio sp. Y2-5]